MTKTFKLFVEYLKKRFSSNHHIILLVIPSAILQIITKLVIITLVTIISMGIVISSHIQKELKEMKSILLMLNSSIGDISNSN